MRQKNETVTESELKMMSAAIMIHIKQLEERVIRMERAFDALGRRLEGSERHVEDEGWFD